MYKRLKKILPALLLALFGLIQYFSLIPAIDNIVHDGLLASQREPLENIVIVGMDERSITEIGTWPWPRFFVADTISKLAEMEAAAIGASILYDVYGMSEEYDLALVKAAGETDRLVLGGMALLGGSHGGPEFYAEDYILPFEELSEVVSVGFLNAEPDETDGVMRKALTSIRYGDIRIHSLPYETYKTYCRVMGVEEHEIPLDSLGQFPINYVSRPGGFTAVSLWAVINDEVDPALIKDAIVLIGPYAQGIGSDSFTTALDHGAPTYGVEINANIVQNMLEGSFKRNSPWWLDLSVLLLIGLAAIVLLNLLKPLWGAVATVALTAAQLAASLFAYRHFDLIMKAGDAIVFLIVCFVAVLVLSILSEQHEKHHIQGMFGRFVAPEVVREILSGGVEIQLGGAEKEITVLFVDIRGFTAFSEANPPDKVVGMVNRYLALTSRSIQENSGTIDKYIGDATMAVFNAPNDLPDHALCAVRAAWAMKGGSVPLREEILEEYGVDLQFGVGVNTGPAIIGNMGSDFRMDYTAIGDTVNTAARLESNAEKGQILISDATYQLVKEHVEVKDLGVLSVKNKKVGVQIYELLGIRGCAVES